MADAIARALDGGLTQGDKTGGDPTDKTPTPTNADAGKEPDADPKADPAAAEPGEKDAAEKSDQEGKEGSETDGDDGDVDLSDDEISRTSPKVQRRIRQLLNQRRAAREQVATYRPDAESYRTIRTFMTVNQLEDAEVAELFQLGAHLKSGDPARLRAFAEAVMPRLQLALEATGASLPEDLRTSVETGELTEAHARELSRARHERDFAAERERRAQSQVQQRDVTDAQRAIAHAVDQWTTQARATDPDFDLKADAMKRVAQGIVLEKGLPKTAEQAVAYAKQAHDEASKLTRLGTSGPKATRPTPAQNTPSASRNGVRAQPTSLEDVINQALARTP